MDSFHIFLAVMTGIAVIVFVALYFVKAGYGMFSMPSGGDRWITASGGC